MREDDILEAIQHNIKSKYLNKENSKENRILIKEDINKMLDKIVKNKVLVKNNLTPPNNLTSPIVNIDKEDNTKININLDISFKNKKDALAFWKKQYPYMSIKAVDDKNSPNGFRIVYSYVEVKIKKEDSPELFEAIMKDLESN